MSNIARSLSTTGGIAAALLVTCASIWTPRGEAAGGKTMTPRRVVEAFERMAFDERRPKEAVLTYFSPDVVDHHPNIAGDRDSIIAHLKRLDWDKAGPQRHIKHIVAEDDIVMVHHHLIRRPGERGIAAVDIFRVKDGLIVEHWDVLQPIPEESVNPRPMF